MKKLLLLVLLVSITAFAQTKEKTIIGMVTDGRSPISNVSVSVEKHNKQVFTDEKGRYEITASKGDVIKYSYQGMKPIRIRVEDVTRVLNPTMVPDVKELDEVVVIGSNRKSQRELELEYSANDNIIKTAYGYLNTDMAPGRVRFLSQKNINSVTTCILDVLRAEFPGVTVVGSCSGIESALPVSSQSSISSNTPLEAETNNNLAGTSTFSIAGADRGLVFIRGGSSINNQTPAIFDVDGQIFTDAPLWVDVNNIYRIAVLGNFGTAVPYGNLGSGGVVVINTISGTKTGKDIVDLARLKNNFYKGSALTQEQALANGPSYQSDLAEAQGLESAKQIYDDYAKRYASSPYFLIDAQHYFATRWNDHEYANEIIESNEWKFNNNAVLLKALAYNYETQGQFEKAHDFYKRVMELRSDYGQSYMDLANSYRDLRDYRQAATIYNRYNHLVEEGMIPSDSTGFTTIINREYNNLLTLNKSAVVDADNAKDLFVEEEGFNGTRLVFEWNDSEAEFDLQFVNPNNQYFLWKHSLADNDETIQKEKELGYSCTEYLIDDSLPGTWQINVTYHGNKSLTPTYLKATVYHDYGSYSQRKEVKVFKLGLKGKNQELFKLEKTSKLVSR